MGLLSDRVGATMVNGEEPAIRALDVWKPYGRASAASISWRRGL